VTGLEFCELARTLNYDFFTGVPDSTLKSVFKTLEISPRYGYVPAVREDNAIGLAAGAYLGGKNPIVLMQNSGLGHCLNALPSLVSLYRIPLLLIVGWRGSDETDAPEHILMGAASPSLLDAVGVAVSIPNRDDFAASFTALAHKTREENSAAALLVRDKVLD
jgi:sulfopyruvate decarboxylase alpha subunit